MKFEIAPVFIKATWDEARMYCFALNVNGKTGWRLPTIAELHEMLGRGLIEPGNYWSSEVTNNHIKYVSPVSVRFGVNGYLLGVYAVRDLE
jgi:formylglycine-generating enzyme required for sulfatase activity